MATITLERIKELRLSGEVIEANDLLRQYHNNLQQARQIDLQNISVNEKARRAVYYRNRIRKTVEKGLCFNCSTATEKFHFYCSRCLIRMRENRRKRLCQKSV